MLELPQFQLETVFCIEVVLPKDSNCVCTGTEEDKRRNFFLVFSAI